MTGQHDRPDYVHGLDVSGWQKPLDWPAVAAAGFVYAWVKATEGQDYVARGLGEHADGIHRRSGGINGAPAMLLGYYHFATPGTSHRDAEREAIHYVRTLADHPPATLRPVLDLERGREQHTRETLTRWVLDWMGAVEEITGVAPILYAGRYLKRVDLAQLTRYPLWIPHYPALKSAPMSLHRRLRDERLDSGRGPRRPDGTPWACWQWTSSGEIAGARGRIDLNIAPSIGPLLRVPSCDDATTIH